MITCSRCSKENQNHYKFCLGCGAKLEAAPPPPAPEPLRPAPAPAAVPLGMAKTAVPPPPLAEVVGLPPDGARGVAGSIDLGAPARRDGTPGPVISGVIDTPPPMVRVAPAPAPGMTAAIPPASRGTVVPAAAPVAPAPSPSRPAPIVPPTAAAPPAAAAPAAAPAPAARDTVTCPKCGKSVGGSYAFCGSCGQRLKPAGGAGPAGPPQRTMFMAQAAQKAAARGHLTLIRPDGTEGGMHPLHEGENLIGRGQGSLFDADPYLSPRHAEFVLNDEGLVVRDLKSLNGVFMKITQEERIDSGDVFRIGQELLRFDLIAPPSPLDDGTEIIGTPNPGFWGRISVVIGRDVDGPAFPLFDESIVLGRERGDILFPEDGYVSGTHAQIALREGQVYLSDLGSSNGTFFRIRGHRAVPPGSLVLMGQQLFRVAFR